jgi:aminopeptidase YwaD
MNMKFLSAVILIILVSLNTFAQGEKRWLKHEITALSSTSMHGRGYVAKGGDKAAAYIQRKFREFGVSSIKSDSSYYQPYSFPINTFPGTVYLKINRKELKPGPDYIVYAGSSPYKTNKVKLRKIDLKNVKDSTSWARIKEQFRPDRAYFLKNSDTVSKYLKHSIRSFAKEFPDGLFILPKHGKLIWTANTDTVPATIIYVEDTMLPKRWIRRASVNVETEFIPSFKSQNVIGVVPGTERPDSFIVFTAHYDHLGQMGRHTVFPGAHDNASGTALMMYMSKFFAAHPQRYSTVFIGFSGEEAGLLGSKHYVNNPLFPLDKIRFLVNLDMTGDATNGITVVNGTENEPEFALMEEINKEKQYLPKINKREKTSNSDHYYFADKGVPAVFIYGNGTKGFYHDVFDVAKELSLENIDGLANLLITLTGRLSGQK